MSTQTAMTGTIWKCSDCSFFMAVDGRVTNGMRCCYICLGWMHRTGNYIDCGTFRLNIVMALTE